MHSPEEEGLVDGLSASDGIAAYNRYTSAVGGVTWDGKPIPEWKDLGDKVRKGWIHAGARPDPNIQFTERELVLVELSKEYDEKYFSAGAPGHSQFILIAKLAKALGL